MGSRPVSTRTERWVNALDNHATLILAVARVVDAYTHLAHSTKRLLKVFIVCVVLVGALIAAL